MAGGLFDIVSFIILFIFLIFSIFLEYKGASFGFTIKLDSFVIIFWVLEPICSILLLNKWGVIRVSILSTGYSISPFVSTLACAFFLLLSRIFKYFDASFETAFINGFNVYKPFLFNYFRPKNCWIFKLQNISPNKSSIQLWILYHIGELF